MLSGALAAITAAVVGVIINLALWFALHSIFRGSAAVGIGGLSLPLPIVSSIDWLALALAISALVACCASRPG